uniref:Uncharacterized protein n=1 Tax=Klebsiella oxytoca TaxID=571 RepID=A0A1Z3MMQ1_KLEOX|nr:hypothetical protein [Klebsiella oxytoca]
MFTVILRRRTFCLLRLSRGAVLTGSGRSGSSVGIFKIS